MFNPIGFENFAPSILSNLMLFNSWPKLIKDPLFKILDELVYMGATTYSRPC